MSPFIPAGHCPCSKLRMFRARIFRFTFFRRCALLLCRRLVSCVAEKRLIEIDYGVFRALGARDWRMHFSSFIDDASNSPHLQHLQSINFDCHRHRLHRFSSNFFVNQFLACHERISVERRRSGIVLFSVAE